VVLDEAQENISQDSRGGEACSPAPQTNDSALQDSHPPIVILKFGGTSVGSAAGRSALCQRVGEQRAAGKTPVVVVSAMGRRGDPYATDTLLDLVATENITPEERDLLASTGEVISAVVVASQLRASGIPAEALTGASAGILTDETPQAATIQQVMTAPLLARIDEGCVPVVCGFQGMSPSGHVTTLGRGGSDTTASALGVALAAQSVVIYTDVDGVMSADPRVVADAQVIDTIRADELFQMAQMGSKVIHTPAAELALASGVSLLIKNTYSDHPGSQVADITAYRPGALATAIASTHDVCRFAIALGDGEGGGRHLRTQTRIYQRLARAQVSLDLFTPAKDTLYFTVACSDAPTVEDALGTQGDGCTVFAFANTVHPSPCVPPCVYTRQDGLAKVTVIGAGMHGVPGVMARIATALEAEDIDIFQVADSHNTISVLIAAEHEQPAVRALHAAFGLGTQGVGSAVFANMNTADPTPCVPADQTQEDRDHA